MLQQEIWELNGHISTLDQENRLMRARNERLEKEIEELLKAK
jgi:cell division protein FtsB